MMSVAWRHVHKTKMRCFFEQQPCLGVSRCQANCTKLVHVLAPDTLVKGEMMDPTKASRDAPSWAS